MLPLQYREVKKIDFNGIEICHYSLLPECRNEVLPEGRSLSHLVARRDGEILWVYNPIDPKTSKPYEVSGLYKKTNQLVGIYTGMPDYGYDYHIELDANTGEVTNTFLTK